MRIPRLLISLFAVAALGLGLAACGDDDGGTSSDTTADGSTTSTSASSSDTTETSEPTERTEPDEVAIPVSVYLLDADAKLRVGWVRTAETTATAQAALESLLEGPTADDESLGLSSAVPEGTTLRSVEIIDGVAVVDLSAEFTTGGGTLSMHSRLGQVVFTVTQFPTVEEVELLVDGSPLTELGGEGVIVDGNLTRADFQFDSTYEWIEPRILVETPRPGESITGATLDVGGWANTFEATVYFEVLGPDGEVLIPESFTTASAGSGTTGMFIHSIPLPDDLTGDLTVVAYDLSAEDGGGRLGETRVPVIRP